PRTARVKPVVRQARTTPAAAETGRPETSKEFAKRIRRLVLHGPREGQEGGKVSGPPESAPGTPPASAEDQDLEDNRQQLANSMDLMTYLSENTEGVDLLQALRGHYAEDPFYRRILEAPKQFKNFDCRNGLVYLRENDRELLCIPDLRIGMRSVREIVILHAHSLLAHLGAFKTLSLLRDHFWWKS
ncbi:hypothetical protein OH77DRAFT_1363574, partial [Trametes cingulata]